MTDTTTMKKADVKIGGKYYANVSGKRCEIQLDAEKPRGGWEATNLSTGKKIVIKSAQRLQGEVDARAGRAKVTTENEPATVESISDTKPAVSAPVKKPKAKAETAPQSDKKLSCVAAALKVLSESDKPLNTKEMIEMMTARGYWSSPGGKTPHATLYSAILRELAKGDDSRFVKTERGRFTARG
jgi:hypothetical protein